MAALPSVQRVRAALSLAGALAAGGGVLPAWQWADAAAARGIDRYVSPRGSDQYDGSRARPWRTLAHAAELVQAGYTVHVAPGRYGGPLTIALGGTADRRVRFVSRRRWGARITASSGGGVVVVAIRGDHVTFEGFDVSGRGGDGSAAISAEGNDVAVVGNRVHDFVAPCFAYEGNGAAGIVVAAADYGNRSGLVDGNLVERIGTGPRDGSCSIVNGIYAAVPDVTVANNIVAQTAGDGITSWHAASALSIVNNLSVSNGGSGIVVGSGDAGATSEGHSGTLVANNIVYLNVGTGITEANDGLHPVGPGNRYLNNLAYANSSGDQSSGIGGLFPGEIVSGTLLADPELVVRRRGANRYVLRSTSPAVDAGTSFGAPSHDLNREPRPQGRGVDIGPYELR